MGKQIEKVEGLKIQLHGIDVAVIAHYAGGKNILTFNPDFAAMPDDLRPVFTLRQMLDPNYLNKPQIRTDKIPPVLSNLLPEGVLRELTAKALQCHTNNEFSILAYLGSNLPGAVIAKPIKAGDVPIWALEQRLSTEPQQIDVKHANTKFSLAGVQMKFSSSHVDGRYHIDQEISEDMWIIKTPSTVHKGVPVNEYGCMKLAEAAGADIPEVRLIELSELEACRVLGCQMSSMPTVLKGLIAAAQVVFIPKTLHRFLASIRQTSTNESIMSNLAMCSIEPVLSG